MPDKSIHKEPIPQDKQQIFQQIDTDILSKKTKLNSVVQKTKSNYSFVWVLDFFALLAALLGGWIVYNIFQEAHVQLVEGQQAVKVLETTLLDQIDKQYRQNLDAKEKELEKLREQLAMLKNDLNERIELVKKQSQEELDRQRKNLEAEYEERLRNAGAEDQILIRAELEEKIKNLELTIIQQQEEKIRTLEADFARQAKDQENAELALQQELAITQQLLQNSQQQLKAKEAEQPSITTTNFQASQDIIDRQNFDRMISLQFATIESYLLQNDFRSAENLLKTIQNEYDSDNAYSQSIERRNADLAYIATIEEFIKLQQQSGVVETLNEQMLSYADGIQAEDLSRIEQNTYINNMEKVIPNIREFLLAYVSTQSQSKEINIEKYNRLLTRARNFANDNEYARSLSTYRDLVEEFSDMPQKREVAQEMFEMFTKQLSSVSNEVVLSTGTNITRDVIYVKNPNGLVIDLIGDTVIIALTLPNIVQNNQQLYVYRPVPLNALQFDYIGTLRIASRGVNQIQALKNNVDVKVGDMIYFTDPKN